MFEHIKVGDTVVRLLADKVPMELVVVEVSEKLIHATIPKRANLERDPGFEWTFSRKNGAEIDLGIGWDEDMTGSFLIMTPLRL